LHDALIALVLERGWEHVSVQEICDRADVGRSTFYTHFADKEEVLLLGFDMLKAAMRAIAAANGPLGFARPLIDHARDNQRLFRALVGKRSGQIVQRRFREVVLELVADDLSHLPAGARRDTAVHAVAGAFLELLMWWVDGRTSLTADDIHAAFMKLSAPLLK
jgi:AcrR family transcriptional regulator